MLASVDSGQFEGGRIGLERPQSLGSWFSFLWSREMDATLAPKFLQDVIGLACVEGYLRGHDCSGVAHIGAVDMGGCDQEDNSTRA